MRKSLQVMREKDHIRGLVPSRGVGIQDKVYGSYLSTLDPRNNEDVQLALAASPDPRFKEFCERVCAPKYRRVSLQSIAKACNISLLEFNNWWNKESTQRAVAIAQNHSLKVTEDMAQDARSVEDVCPRCDGLTWVGAPAGLPKGTKGYRLLSSEPEDKWIRDCPKCSAVGTVRKPGDSHARDRLLEMAGITQRGKAGVQIVQNFGGAAHSSAVTQLDVMTLNISADE